jgi:hypothetical protein
LNEIDTALGTRIDGPVVYALRKPSQNEAPK